MICYATILTSEHFLGQVKKSFPISMMQLPDMTYHEIYIFDQNTALQALKTACIIIFK